MSRSLPFARPWLDAIDARWPTARRRAGPIALTALIEIVLLLLLLSLGVGSGGRDEPLGQIVTTFDAARETAPTPEPEPAAEPAAAAPAQPPQTTQTPPSALPSPPPVALPRVPTLPPVAPPAAPTAAPSPAPSTIRAVVRSDMGSNRGPADTGARDGDSQRIAGSGPNGEPLYAAKWYREPTDDEYRGYFSRVTGSSGALINCRTEAGFRVDHCVLVDEWPERSGAGSAVLAMAWQFRVRPPRIGGRSMVGEWVRIRIDYRIRRE